MGYGRYRYNKKSADTFYWFYSIFYIGDGDIMVMTNVALGKF